jgi:type IV pilus assembly protein PilB
MPPRKRIGDLLTEKGYITGEQLTIGLEEQKRTGELLGSVLFSLGFLSEKDLFNVLSLLANEQTKAEKTNELPNEIENLVRQSALAFSTEHPVAKREIESINSPLVNLVEKLLINGIQQGATDLHIGPDTNRVRVRYRVDGILHHGMFLPSELLNHIVSRFKIIGQMNIAETRIPQDGSTEFFHKNRKVDLRISTFPVIGGENVVVRLLDKAQLLVGLENLGFFENDSLIIRKSLTKPYGMILVTGPTGSGKTTTLYSCLSMINTVNRNIFTIEDPVEYQLPLARQSQINIKAGFTFATGLRSILRQDPDVILIGEMRDLETSNLAVSAALTGHLVFSTLHTNDAVSSIARLVEIGVDPFLISATLDSIIAQRLLRVLCPKCKDILPHDHPSYNIVGMDKGGGDLFQPIGCNECNNSGFKGRTVIYEVLRISPEISQLINGKSNLMEIRRLAIKEGLREMHDVALDKVRMGVTTLDEVYQTTRLEM